MSKPRCAWVTDDPLYQAYHDQEWGVPVHDDRLLFEFLCLEGAQAGLSWITVLKKRARYRQVMDNFDPVTVARYSQARILKLLTDPGIIRNRRKVASCVNNARMFLNICGEFGSFEAYVWRFVNGRPIQNAWKTGARVPATSAEAQALSRDLKQRGFSFVGPVVCYAFMQAVGMVNDHLVSCFRYADLNPNSAHVSRRLHAVPPGADR